MSLSRLIPALRSPTRTWFGVMAVRTFPLLALQQVRNHILSPAPLRSPPGEDLKHQPPQRLPRACERNV
jgi:hypothetical protein